MRTVLAALALATLTTLTASAHSGGTNAAGCHTNSRTGDYHCHTPKTPRPDRATYCHVTTEGDRRCGYARSSCQNLTRQWGGTCERRGR